MLFFQSGEVAGTVGGGCIEAEVWAEARERCVWNFCFTSLFSDGRGSERGRNGLRRHNGHFYRRLAKENVDSFIENTSEASASAQQADAQHRIPMIVISLRCSIRLALGARVVCSWLDSSVVGHAVEGNRPAFFRNPMYLLVGPGGLFVEQRQPWLNQDFAFQVKLVYVLYLPRH